MAEATTTAADDQYPNIIPDLIPSLPGDVALDCLHRLPVHTLPVLSRVSRAWSSVASGIGIGAFYESRHRLGYSTHYICLLLNHNTNNNNYPSHHLSASPRSGTKSPPCYGIGLYDCREHRILAPDPRRHDPLCLPMLPGLDAPGLPLFCRCVSLGHRLVVLGGWHPVTWAALPCVFLFDFATGLWLRGADMPSPVRSLFAAEALADGRRILVAGGHDAGKNALSSAHVYDAVSDTWRALPDMSSARDECKAVLVGDKLVVVSGYSHVEQGRFLTSCETYDPRADTWGPVAEDMWIRGGRNPSSAMALHGELHALVDRKLVKWTAGTSDDDCKAGRQRRRCCWEAVLELPAEIAMAVCAAPLPKGGGIVVSGFSGGGGQPFEAAIWWCEHDTTGGKARWQRVGKKGGFGSVVQLGCIVEV